MTAPTVAAAVMAWRGSSVPGDDLVIFEVFTEGPPLHSYMSFEGRNLGLLNQLQERREDCERYVRQVFPQVRELAWKNTRLLGRLPLEGLDEEAEALRALKDAEARLETARGTILKQLGAHAAGTLPAKEPVEFDGQPIGRLIEDSDTATFVLVRTNVGWEKIE